MSNTATHLGREQEVAASGRTWKLARWDRAVWWKFLDWARGKIDNPLDAVEPTLKLMVENQARCLARAVQKDVCKDEQAQLRAESTVWEARANDLLRMALDQKRIHLSVNDPAIDAILHSMEGLVFVLHQLLLPAQPEATEDDAYAILRTVGDVWPLLYIALGNPPPPNPKNE